MGYQQGMYVPSDAWAGLGNSLQSLLFQMMMMKREDTKDAQKIAREEAKYIRKRKDVATDLAYEEAYENFFNTGAGNMPEDLKKQAIMAGRGTGSVAGKSVDSLDILTDFMTANEKKEFKNSLTPTDGRISNDDYALAIQAISSKYSEHLNAATEIARQQQLLASGGSILSGLFSGTSNDINEYAPEDVSIMDVLTGGWTPTQGMGELNLGEIKEQINNNKKLYGVDKLDNTVISGLVDAHYANQGFTREGSEEFYKAYGEDMVSELGGLDKFNLDSDQEAILNQIVFGDIDPAYFDGLNIPMKDRSPDTSIEDVINWITEATEQGQQQYGYPAYKPTADVIKGGAGLGPQ